MTRYFYDTEFLEDGRGIDLISIGIVAEDGREYYAVNANADWSRIERHEWLTANVVPQLPVVRHDDGVIESIDFADPAVKHPKVIASEVAEFILATEGEHELWADYGAYDHVVLCQLWGPMIALPAGVPMFTHDLQQLWRFSGRPELPAQVDEHNALADARHAREIHRVCADRSTPEVRMSPEGDLVAIKREPDFAGSNPWRVSNGGRYVDAHVADWTPLVPAAQAAPHA